MKFFILCYNPQFINPEALARLIEELTRDEIKIYMISHLDRTMAPLYILNSDDSKLDIYLKEVPRKEI